MSARVEGLIGGQSAVADVEHDLLFRVEHDLLFCAEHRIRDPLSRHGAACRRTSCVEHRIRDPLSATGRLPRTVLRGAPRSRIVPGFGRRRSPKRCATKNTRATRKGDVVARARARARVR
jgi:hypothetical protein